jgi:hypothetical protein
MRDEQLAQRDLEDDDAIRSTLQRHETPDTAIEDLYKQGRAEAAAKLGKSINEERKKAIEAYDARLASGQKRIEYMSNALKGIKPGDTVAYKALRPHLVEVGMPLLGQAINDMLPTEYNAETVNALVTAGMKHSERLTAEHNAASLLKDAYTAGAAANPWQPARGTPGAPDYQPAGPLWQEGVQPGAQWSKTYQDMQGKFLEAASLVLPQSQNKTQWDAYLTQLHGAGMSDDTAKLIPRWNDEKPDEAREGAKLLGLTQKQRADIAHQKKTEEHQAAANRIAERRVTAYENRAPAGAGGAAAQKPLTRARQSVLIDQRNRALRKLDDEYRDTSGKVVAGETQEELDNYLDRRLQIEDDHRVTMGWGSFMEAAEQAVEDNDRASYNVVKQKYEAITGGKRKLDQLIPWEPPVKTSSDRGKRIKELTKEYDDPKTTPQRKAEIEAKLRELNTQPSQ